MKKKSSVRVTRTRSKVAHIVLRVDVSWPKDDADLCEKACKTVAGFLRDLMTPAEREAFLAELQQAARPLENGVPNVGA